jgi:hypothetical protein
MMHWQICNYSRSLNFHLLQGLGNSSRLDRMKTVVLRSSVPPRDILQMRRSMHKTPLSIAERPGMHYFTVGSHPAKTKLTYFLPFFFLMLPLSLTAGLSTMMGSSSLLPLLMTVLAGVDDPSLSSSFKNSFLIESLRFSHQSFSDSVCAWISSSRFRKTVFAAISFADWKID